ncbi:stimulated by retinoic acid gene 6 protein-like isoform X2 [Actinia tenebrosa]|uniref:Stimulated by retinoic acid gene 6 protein-like isoform X2 n=1 Tax=Actinia tenebrosa TaxID=6105 RepID=A0A6P8HRE8_ACTTE|nr:stimulated by retinoic acid gene 6 protein-like isoform X2 [Actinia tenebrosa]
MCVRKEEATTITLAGKTERAHVNLLFSNQLHQAGKRPPNQNGTWYNLLKNWIYVARPDFKFSTQFLSSFVVSCIFVYQVTVVLLMLITVIISLLKPFLKAMLERNTGLDEALVALQLFQDYSIASVLLACLFAIMQLGFFLRSHRNDVLKTYRTKRGLLPDEILHPKILVGKSLSFCGHQTAFTAIGLLVNVLSVFFLLLPIFVFHLLSKIRTADENSSRILNVIVDILPLIVTPIFTSIAVILLSHFVFKDHSYPDMSITVNNRRLFGIMSYFFFFFNIFVGLWSGLLRVVKGAVIVLVFLPRVDRTIMMRGYRRFDKAYMAYIGFLSVLVAFKHPVMLCFCQLLLEGVRRREAGQTTIASRPRVSGKALNRWFLVVLLMHNPSLVRHRKQGVRPRVQLPSTSDVKVEVSPIDLEDTFPPAERLKSLDVY